MEEPSQSLQAAVVQFAHLELENSEIDEAAVEAARKERQEAEDTERERAEAAAPGPSLGAEAAPGPTVEAVAEYAYRDIEREVIDEARIAAAREEREQWEAEALAAARGDHLKARQFTWARCDRCDIWRRLLGVKKENLPPGAWYCEMSSDEQRNTCDAEEEKAEDEEVVDDDEEVVDDNGSEEEGKT